MRNLLRLVMLIFGLVGCGDYATDLGKGYSYVQLDGVNHVISDPHKNIIIFPTVEKYFSDENYIIGIRSESKRPIDSHDSRFISNYGYFFVDKNSKSIESGLTREQLIAVLRVKHLEGMVSKVLE